MCGQSRLTLDHVVDIGHGRADDIWPKMSVATPPRVGLEGTGRTEPVTSALRLSTIILPIYRRPEVDQIWCRAEELGFHAAYTYDHLSWRSFRDGPWFATVPTLAAASYVTHAIRLGTMVTSPNFRHPVTFAKDLITLDDLSGGRITLGIGSGGTGFDATALGNKVWTPAERAERFAEFLPLLGALLEHDVVTSRGAFYSAQAACNIPGCLQRPSIPFVVAANGPRAMRLAAEHGQGWVTTDLDTNGQPAASPLAVQAVLRARLAKLEVACERAGRDINGIDRVLVHHPMADEPMTSVDAFVDWAGGCAELGFTELVVHWPVPESVFAANLRAFEAIATDAMAQLP